MRFLGTNGTGMDDQDCSRDQLNNVLASEDKPVAEGVVEMRQMEGIGGLDWDSVITVGDLESNGIFIKILKFET